MTTMTLRAMTDRDGPTVLRIFEEGITTGNATFETSAPSWEKWDAGHLRECRIVAVDDSDVVGWAALSAVSDRCVYAGVAELSVYVAETARGRGLGSALMEQLIAESEAAGFWTLKAGVFPENAASVALHERFGFRIVGTHERVGQMNGVWRDTLLLERRSAVVGQ